MPDNVKLKPCPFCGAAPVFVRRLRMRNNKPEYRIACHTINCFVCPGAGYWADSECLREAWNTRHGETT